jgi:hypothetical protein
MLVYTTRNHSPVSFDFRSIKVFALPNPYGHSKLHLSLWLEWSFALPPYAIRIASQYCEHSSASSTDAVPCRPCDLCSATDEIAQFIVLNLQLTAGITLFAYESCIIKWYKALVCNARCSFADFQIRTRQRQKVESCRVCVFHHTLLLLDWTFLHHILATTSPSRSSTFITSCWQEGTDTPSSSTSHSALSNVLFPWTKSVPEALITEGGVASSRARVTTNGVPCHRRAIWSHMDSQHCRRNRG